MKSINSSAGVVGVLCAFGIVSSGMAEQSVEPPTLAQAYEHTYSPEQQGGYFSRDYGRAEAYAPAAPMDYTGGTNAYRGYDAPVDYSRDYVTPPATVGDGGFRNAPHFVPQTERSYYRPAPATAQQQMQPAMPMAVPGFGLPEAFTKTFNLPGFTQAWNMDLPEAQRDELRDLQKGLRRINHALSGELMDAVDGIQDVFDEAVRDPKRVGKAYQQYFDIQRRWIEAQIAASNRVNQITEAARRVHEEMVVPVPAVDKSVPAVSPVNPE